MTFAPFDPNRIKRIIHLPNPREEKGDFLPNQTLFIVDAQQKGETEDPGAALRIERKTPLIAPLLIGLDI